jgi:hypothetical protein
MRRRKAGGKQREEEAEGDVELTFVRRVLEELLDDFPVDEAVVHSEHMDGVDRSSPSSSSSSSRGIVIISIARQGGGGDERSCGRGGGGGRRGRRQGAMAMAMAAAAAILAEVP